jgi:hypothetical protein
MGTLYRKVAVSERMPPPMTDILVKYIWSDCFQPYHYFDDLHCKDEMLNEVTHWIEEIPDPTTQLQADKAELLEALEVSNCVLVNCSFEIKGETSYQVGVRLSNNESLIKKMKK